MKTREILAIAMTVLVLALFPSAYVQGAEPGEKASGSAAEGSEGWEFGIAPYIWFVTIDGDVTIKGQKESVDVSIFDILDSSDFAFGLQVHMEAHKDKWGFYIDPTWIVIEDNDVGPLNVDITQNIAIVELGALYKFEEGSFGGEPDDATWAIHGVLGGRYMYMNVDFDFPVMSSRDQSQDWFDPYLGARGVFRFAKENRWSFLAQGDFGGFGVGSDFTWSLSGLLGYDFHIGKVPATFVFGYRALYQDFEDGSGPNKFAWDVTMHGPMTGLFFRF